MKLIKLTSKKTEAKPKTLRRLSTVECQEVSGGRGADAADAAAFDFWAADGWTLCKLNVYKQ